MSAKMNTELKGFDGFEIEYLLYRAGKIEKSRHWDRHLARA
jgi:hypothetical protein